MNEDEEIRLVNERWSSNFVGLEVWFVEDIDIESM